MLKETELIEEVKFIQAFNPVTNQIIKEKFTIATPADIDNTIVMAEQAFHTYSKTSYFKRAAFLRQIGIEINNLSDELIRKCGEETGLPAARIINETSRTVMQINLFADLLIEGSWLNTRIDTADPNRMPLPKPDIRQTQIPIGPVGVFEASNFPLAFSTAGGDTASALAAGCTVIAKSHSGHPGTSALIAKAIHRAIEVTGMPAGTFSLVHGPGKAVGMHIVNHPLIKAIGFTGSFTGGKALFDAATKRPEPIPVFAEMGSINPVFVLPEATKLAEEIAVKLVDSIVLGTGQFCTNPGLIIVDDSNDCLVFIEELKKAISKIEESTMLSVRIKEAFDEGISRFTQSSGVYKLASGIGAGKDCLAVPHIFSTSFQSFIQNEELSEEVFGPTSLVVTTNGRSEMQTLANQLTGHLTISIFCTNNDLHNYADLISILERKAGRLIINGVPTGVEVCHAMVHGGPFPATTDGRSTSVGTSAIYRFTRLVSFQNFPDDFLPDELKDSNPLGANRLVNGSLSKERLS